MNTQNSLISLGRLMSLKDASPFNLVVDSVLQSAHYLVMDFVQKSDLPVILLGFETVSKPAWATHFLDCQASELSEAVSFVAQRSSKNEKALVIIDSLNYLALEDLSSFVSEVMSPYNSTLAVFHSNCPQLSMQNYPSSVTLLTYIASAVLYVEPPRSADDEDTTNLMERLILPIDSHHTSRSFRLILVTKKKSGKSVTHRFAYDKTQGEYEIWKEEKVVDPVDENNVLTDLSTFNLNTSDKQKIAKEQVELPFMEAQAELGRVGGAIVYQFEKDDDYDEEDPYEDPF